MINGEAEGIIIGVSDDATHRSNLLLQNTLRSPEGILLPGTAHVAVYDRFGQHLGTQSYNLQAGEFRQHNRFLNGLGYAENVTVRVTFSGAGTVGGLDARVSEVNGNLIPGTNDGRLISAELYRPGE